MTFNRMAFRIFKADVRRYLLFFLCSSFTIMIFFTYSTLLTNRDFMNPDKVNTMISSNTIAPSVVIILFSVFFIFYTQNSFLKFRKVEFGMFMVLGMTNKNIRRIILIENGIIAIVSIAAGLLAGTLFSGIFYAIVMKIIQVDGIPFTLALESYLYTVLFFGVLYFFVIIESLILSLRYDIISLLKENKKEDRNLLTGAVSGIVGIGAIGAAFIDMAVNSKSGEFSTLLRSILVCFVGIYLVISGFIYYLIKVFKHSKKNYIKNMLFLSNMKYSFGQLKKILFLISLLVGITIFFSSIGVILVSDSLKYAVQNNPYHLAYAEILGKNSISEEALNNIITNGETPLTSRMRLDYIDNNVLKLLSAAKVNAVLKTDLQVEKGHFINLFQIIENDGYAHDTSEIKNVDINTKDGNKTLISQGIMKKMLFNNIPIVGGRFLIINDDDYMSMEAVTDPEVIGHINLLNFEDWKKTKAIVEKLDTELANYNKANTKQYFNTIEQDMAAFKSVSRIGEYLERTRSSSYLLFLLVFVGLLFYISSGVILHFRLMNEIEREKVKYKKLYKIGITKGEASKTISRELKVLFFLPYILGIMFAAFYIHFLMDKSGMSTASVAYTLLLGIIYLVLQCLYYMVYRRIYLKNFYYLYSS